MCGVCVRVRACARAFRRQNFALCIGEAQILTPATSDDPGNAHLKAFFDLVDCVCMWMTWSIVCACG